MKFLRIIAWLLRALLFVALLLFAVKNTDPVTLRFYLDQSWQAPLILVIVVFFAAGAALGVLACLTRLFAQRREIQALKKAAGAPPAPDRSPLAARGRPEVPPAVPPIMGA